MAKNPTTPETYEKLIRTCKYFYSKNPIIVVSRIEIWKNHFHISKNQKHKQCPMISNLNQISCKFWVTGQVCVADSLNFAISILREKVLQMKSLKFMRMYVPIDTIASIKAVKLVKELVCFHLVPEYADGTLMPVEKVFESFPNLEVFLFFM